MDIELKQSALKQTRWYEYLIRFVFGGLVTVATGLVTKQYGPVIGGLFLAFPAIFPASVTLVQTHQKKQEEEQGEDAEQGDEHGKQAAGITAEGSALGSIGLAAFAIIVWRFAASLPAWLVLLLALLFWFGISVFTWWIYKKTISQDPGR